MVIEDDLSNLVLLSHDSEKTQWDHPAMVEILEQLCSFNQVKFSAYRTAMKLRALQKRLCCRLTNASSRLSTILVDLIDLPDLIQSFQRISDYADEDRLKLEDMVLCLVPLFERVHQQFPHLMKNVPLAVDLVVNLLLNIYDPYAITCCSIMNSLGSGVVMERCV